MKVKVYTMQQIIKHAIRAGYELVDCHPCHTKEHAQQVVFDTIVRLFEIQPEALQSLIGTAIQDDNTAQKQEA